MIIKVLMASHLGSLFRYDTIKRALKSIADQTQTPDFVLLAYSYDHHEPDIAEWVSILGNIPLVTIKSSTKLCQFDHYKNLLELVDDTDLICFLDDDDLYRPDKIETISNIVQKSDFKGIIRHIYWEFYDAGDEVLCDKDDLSIKFLLYRAEFWTFCIYGFILKKFFDNEFYPEYYSVNPHLVDVYFAVWIDSCYKPIIKLCEKPLMYSRKNFLIPRDYRCNSETK